MVAGVLIRAAAEYRAAYPAVVHRREATRVLDRVVRRLVFRVAAVNARVVPVVDARCAVECRSQRRFQIVPPGLSSMEIPRS